MEKIVKISTIMLIIFIISGCMNKNFKVDLPNNYQIRSNNKMITKVGFVKNNKFYINYKNKKVGVDDYVAEYQYSDNFIGLKCVVKDTLEVIYYIIDTKNNDVYGPYKDNDTYVNVKNKITNNEKFIDFISVSLGNK